MSIQMNKTPEDCIEKLKEGFSDKNHLLIDIDQIVVLYGFKLTKKNGGKDYVYFTCHMSGKGRKIPEIEKQKHTSSKKQVNLFANSLIYIIIDCPFQIAYIWGETEKKYKFNDKKTCFDHNHE